MPIGKMALMLIVGLMAVAVSILGGVASLPEKQLQVETITENIDIRSILQGDHLEMRSKVKCKEMYSCRRAGGKCQSDTIRCDGDFQRGRKYCKSKGGTCGCCIPPPTPTPKVLGCVFGDTSYSHTDILEKACMQFKCFNGNWTYIVKINKKCGECFIHGEPHINLYNPGQNYQTFGGIGTYAISQLGFEIHPLFGVKSNFEPCFAPGISCVGSATYFEPGLNVSMILPSPLLTDYCNNNTYSVVDPATDPKCMIKVMVNNEERIINNSVESFYSTDGTVLVFKHNHINSSKDLNCINIVGSKGFSVSLCQYLHDYAWFYVWAMPHLQSKIYGLCNTFPGNINEAYIDRNGSTVYDYNESAESWKINGNPYPDIPPAEDRCENTTVLNQIEDQCSYYTVVCPIHHGSFSDACVYDLCHVTNPDRYAEGYGSHVLVHNQISVSSDKCSCEFVIDIVSGCIITEAAPHDRACHCTEWWYLLMGAPVYICFGTVVNCTDPESTWCINPSTNYESCLQGQDGNCGGYLQ